ncbi:transmembrane protein [Spiroplasma clarkii]|uniref:Transmembrane protein n=1 Tax=Spiroplasma clarkii TaxID=2139 RepID=A0A1Y0L1Y7_9MOLU|nr:hypothetical protein [Spiroplasma clarkii]ARU92034.1 transmembrane protein [Spiroplasma clarkii]ATX71365.1 hypothetical protein SCLAR_v1c10650 [Spiroplasma clarkii]
MENNKDKDINDVEHADHEVAEHSEQGSKAKKDHYHDIHHFDASGNHDDVILNDFHFKNSIYTSQKNLIYRITLTGVFLALAIGGTAFDIFLEFIHIPIAGINISFRFFDILFILLSIGSIGPIFASLIAAVVPWMHLVIDSAHAHTWIDAMMDFGGYLLAVWVLWLFYYVIFRNSYIHKDPNRKKDLFKRWLPMPFYVIILTLFYTTLITLLIRFSVDTIFVAHEHEHEHEEHVHEIFKMINALEEHHEHSEFEGKWAVLIFGLFGFELLRFSACYAAFAVVEPQVKKLNHRYR